MRAPPDEDIVLAGERNLQKIALSVKEKKE
jgi:hypothetical protein